MLCCLMDQVPYCLKWDLEKRRAVKGPDPFTQPSHSQAGRAPCGYEKGLEDKFSGENGDLIHAKAAVIVFLHK